jgi:hypothetical protein
MLTKWLARRELNRLLTRHPEVGPGLLWAVEQGRIYGRVYGGWSTGAYTGCLYAHAKAITGQPLRDFVDPDTQWLTPLETFIHDVVPGDVPATSPVLAQVRQWLRRRGITPQNPITEPTYARSSISG